MRCDLCGKHFGLARWRHHCCHCDREVCAPCKTPHRLSTPANARKRACAACVAGLASDGRRATAFALPRFVPGAVTTLLSVLHGAHSVGAGVFGFLTTREACTLRLVSQECREAVAAARWHDGATHISGSLAAWRACFPGAVAANVEGRRDLRDEDFVHLAGVKVLNMSGCNRITNAGLAHLTGVYTLDMGGCVGITDAGLAHLTGIHMLNMSGCTGITNSGLSYLTGIHTLNVGYLARITDAGLAHLAGIHTLDMGGCTGITDAGLAHLTGIHTLYMGGCHGITDAGLAHLTGIHTLHMRECSGITDAGLAHLTGIRQLIMRDCAPAAVAAARARGLPVVAQM